MSSREPESPWLGGPGARWAQVLLFALHIALLVSLIFLYVTFQRVRHRVPFERWQEMLLLFILGVSFVVFALRTWRIGASLWRALKGPSDRPES